MSDDTRAKFAEAKARFAALPPEEQRRRLKALVDFAKADCEIVDIDEDAVLTFDDVSDDGSRAVYVEAMVREIDNPECVEVSVPMRFDEERMRKLLTWGQAWLDAPRDAARAATEIVAEDDGVRLLKTTLGEWGVGSEDEPAGEVTWFGGEHAEYDARRLFAEERGKVACLGCAVEVDEDDSAPANDDGDRYCPTCAEEDKAEFNATTFGHDRGSPGEDGCAWTGPGSEIVDFDEDALCPKCDAPVQRVAMAAPASDAVVPA